jgi:hypothetical protein
MSTNLSFAKIVATHTERAWSQVYHAGNLFAVVALTTEDEKHDLNSLGKAMFNELEVEFFSLDSKTLPAIREVIEQNSAKLPKDVTLSACIAFSKEALLYLFVIGTGEILMKRGESIGVLLRQKEPQEKALLSSSGYLKHGDILLLQTAAFAALFPDTAIHEALELHVPNDIMEKLSSGADTLPGDASVLTIMYHGASSPAITGPAPNTPAPEEKPETKPHPAAPEENTDEETADPPLKRPVTEEANAPEKEAVQTENNVTEPVQEREDPAASRFAVVSGFRLPTVPLPSKRIIFGAAALLILGILLFSIFFTKQQKVDTETQGVYEQVLKNATQKYEEGEGLKNLNASLAQDDFKQAAAIIKNGLPKVKKGSPEEKELLALLQKIEANLVAAEGASVETKSVDLSESPLLSLAVDRGALAIAEQEKKQYALTAKGVFTKDEAVLENEDSWSSPAGLGVYNGNLYVLDKKNGVLKFLPGSEGYGKSTYFSGDAPSMSNAVSMSIDGSVWILMNDGSIKKFTKGAADSFTASGIPSPLKSPKQIVTTEDSDNLYILDSGNSRIVVIGKDGAFKKAYKADVLGTATFIDVHEGDNKIYILKGKNLSMLSLE